MFNKIVQRTFELAAQKMLSIPRPDIALKLHCPGIRFMNASFSQFGEDLIVYTMLSGLDRCKGIYVDVGAFDPFEYSNTCKLHQQGWSGINIDLSEEKIHKFKKYRPKDINIVAAVGSQKKKMKCLKYEIPLMDRITALEDTDDLSIWGKDPISSSIIETNTLNEILDKHYKEPPQIDFLNIDCEGNDFDVLQSINLKKYMPELIAVETTYESCNRNMFNTYLEAQGYALCGLTKLTSIYGRNAI
jgi:FkbM family methyltransferase